MRIQTSLSPDGLQAKLKELGPWFYPFEFDQGIRPDTIGDADLAAIHESRARAIFTFLDRHFAGRWPGVRCLDVACHEGWFALQVAQHGARRVQGVDVRAERIARANFIREAGGFKNVSFEIGDLFQLDPARDGTFELTFYLGIFYHLEDPMRGFRAVRALTREVCVIEGQVARHQGELTTAWGRKEEVRSGPPIVVIDSDPEHAAHGAALSLVPSLGALEKMLRAAGFSRLEVVEPTPFMHEQYRSRDRVILFAFL